MRLAALYTVYGRRAGAELFVEKTLQEIQRVVPDWTITVLCNKQAREILKERLPSVTLLYIPTLDHRTSKAFWLEFLSHRTVNCKAFDLFWLPSVSASFPGHWDIPSVATFLDMGGFLVPNRWSFRRSFYCKHISTPRSIRRAAAFTSISQATADDAMRLFPEVKTPHVIHLGTSPRCDSPLTESPESIIEKEIGLQLSSILFSPARTDYLGKGRDILLRAYKEYREASSAPLPLLMPGPQGAFHEKVMEDIQSLGLTDSAIWPGRVSDRCIEAFYQISHAMLMPSRTEGFGFPILEAMSHRVPVICSDAGSLPEVSGGAALLFPSGQVQGLLKALLRLEKEPSLRDELIQKGLKRCEDFSWERTAQGYIKVFESTCLASVP